MDVSDIAPGDLPGKSQNLFGWRDWPPDTTYPHSPGWKEQTTSREAALAIASKAKNLRANVLNLLADTAPEALSADQIAIRLQRSPLSIRPRVSELAAAGLIERAGERVTNESGMTAHKWRARHA
jgi:predicted transcriptional regulator